MRIPVLDMFALIPLILCMVVQGIVCYLTVKTWKSKPDQYLHPSFFRVLAIVVGFFGFSAILAVFIPSLFLFALCILFASAILLYGIAKYYAFSTAPPEKESPPETGAEVESPNDDTLVNLGLEFVSHVSGSLSQEIDLTRLLDYINDTLVSSVKADGGVIFLTDDFEDIIAVKSYKGKFPPPYKLSADVPHKPVRVETNFRYAQFSLGETIFGEVAVSGKPLMIADGSGDDRVFANGPEDFLKPGSYIVVPLRVNDRVVGVAGLARIPENAAFTDVEFKNASTLATYAGAAINNVYGVQEVLERADLEREASIAAQIQKTLQPKRFPELPEVGFGSFFTATKGVCGDYYDLILARRDRISLIVADVAGKGIQSSMVMIMLRSILHLVTNTTKSAGTILDWVNKGITGKIDMDHYATVAFASYNPAEHTLEYASAGHQPMIVWRASAKKTELIRQSTDPIGVERSSVYADLSLTVQPGDIIMLYTDGLIETLNPEGIQYGIDTLSRVVEENNSLTAKELASLVKRNLQAFAGTAGQHDDQTLVVMKIKA